MDEASASRAREGDGRVPAPPDINPSFHLTLPDPGNSPVNVYSSQPHFGVNKDRFDAFEKSFYNPTDNIAPVREQTDVSHFVLQNATLNSERIPYL